MDPTTAEPGAAELLERGLVRDEQDVGVSYEALVEHQAETEAKYRNLVEQLPCVVYLAEYGPTGEWLYVSPRIEHGHGDTHKEWLGSPHPQGACAHHGAPRVCDEDGNPNCLQGIMFDITKLRDEEERLTSLDRLKNTLLHTLS